MVLGTQQTPLTCVRYANSLLFHSSFSSNKAAKTIRLKLPVTNSCEVHSAEVSDCDAGMDDCGGAAQDGVTWAWEA